MDDLLPLVAVLALFVGLPWVILHYITKWKTAATLTTGDEALLEELYQLARRLDERMNTVERLVAADHPEFRPARAIHDSTGNEKLDELEKLLAAKERTTK